jgi:hypothetical protein
VSGAVLALVAWLPWYEGRAGELAFRFRAWDLGIAAVVAVLLALVAAGRALLVHNRPPKPNVPVTAPAETLVWSAAAVLLMTYRVLDVPSVRGTAGARTTWLAVAALAVVVQAAFAARKLGRTGLRP